VLQYWWSGGVQAFQGTRFLFSPVTTQQPSQPRFGKCGDRPPRRTTVFLTRGAGFYHQRVLHHARRWLLQGSCDI